MALPSSDEPTQGTGGARVVDSNGEVVGTIANIRVPSEDIARVAIALDPTTQARHGLMGGLIDVEASWLGVDAHDANTMRLNRPLDEALKEQGFNVGPEIPGREGLFTDTPETEPL